MMRTPYTICLVIAASAGSVTTRAEVIIETVTIRNPGNEGELSGQGAGGYGPDRICGAVDYMYDIGKFEITAGQYTEFLNAVAATDTYGLYTTDMAHPGLWERGCNIIRSGLAGSYTYSVAPDWANRPVNYVSWSNAARFGNWLHNGQPQGAQDLTTTEDGSYFLDGATSNEELFGVTRRPDATWVIPTEDEWYKAAYHKNDGTSGSYWDYPTSSDANPSNLLVDPDPGNNACFYQVEYTIGAPYWRTEVGDFENSDSPYGTFDQGGNIAEWNETTLYNAHHGFRGGSWFYYVHDLHAKNRDGLTSNYKVHFLGFRMALVPEPATIVLLALGSVGLLGCRKR